MPENMLAENEVLNEGEDIINDEESQVWIQLQNFPQTIRENDIRSFLMSHLGVSEITRVRLLRDAIYFTLPSQEEANKAVNVLNGVLVEDRAVRAAIGSPKWSRGHERNEKSIPVDSMGTSRGGGLLARPVGDTAPIRRTSDELDNDRIVVRSGAEVVSPLTNMEYSDQLERKMNDAEELVDALLREMIAEGVENVGKISVSDILQPGRYCSRRIACCNKCEFTVGRDLDGKICVGFIAKRQLSATESSIVSVEKYAHISGQMKRIVRAFRKFVVDSGEEPLNELEHIGVWKSLTIRECGGDVLITVMVMPMKDSEREEELKKALVERFLRDDNLSNEDSRFRVTSVYWERIADGGGISTLENIGGAPYIYETIDGTRFRILPHSYFPTNSSAARIFFSTIAEKTGLLDEVKDSTTDSEKLVEDAEEMIDDGDDESADKSRQTNDSGPENGELKDSMDSTNVVSMSTNDDEGDMPRDGNCVRERADESEESSAAKRRKLHVENMEEKRVSADVESTAKGNIILNLGCGMGSIGLYVMCMLRSSKHAAERKFLFGNDPLSEVIEGAKHCARDNGFTEEECRFLIGRTEDIIPILHEHLPVWANENEVNMVGILDPRGGRINDNVAIACRKLSSMKRLIFVSSEPSLALRNFIDICKPKWKKYEGEPFKLVSVTPIDMFPQSERCEWVVQLDRHS